VRALDVDPLAARLGELGDTVKKARSYIHTFDRSDFRQVVLPAEKTIRDMAVLVEEADAEYRERRAGLAVSLALIGSLALLLYLKLRQLERSRRGPDGSSGAGTPS
jgi:hypothetical protein